ncbi:MAG TPA: LLM class flavin-dependent oxidoreductase [Actinomycetota bacterium]|nr:LLM class flavin-dependent oxidoreductase [Actinomycetota bacterium]
MGVQVGIGLFTGQLPPGSGRTFAREYRETLDLVRLAEALGFDSAWVSEHHGSSDGYLPSLLPMLGAFAAATERIKLGTGVLLAPLHDPLRVAEDAAVVDLVSGGRLILGLGLGWREEEFRTFDVPLSERAGRTAEAVEILRRAWTGERFSFEGKFHSYDQVKVTPAPERPDGGSVPIYLGGMVDATVRRAGRLADGWIRTRAIGPTDEIGRQLRSAEEGARDAGRDPSSFGFAQLQNLFVWEDGDAWAVVEDAVAHQLGVYGAWAKGGDTPGTGLEVPPPDEAGYQALTPTGTPHEVAQRLRPFVEAFAGRSEFHLIVRLHYPGMEFETASRAIELFAERVIPALKGA